MRSQYKFLIILLIILICLFLVYSLSPQDKTLGIGTSLVLLHGAWVWTGLTAFSAAALLGLFGLISRKDIINRLSKVSGITALFFWVTYLPMSVLVMQANWSGLFFEEPRWKIPFAFAIIALLLQGGLAIINKTTLTSAGNLVFGIALIYLLSQAGNVLHPDSPVFTGSKNIQITFVIMFILSLMLAMLACRWLYQRLFASSVFND